MIRKKIDIKVSFHCNNKCEFCAQGHKRDFIKPRTKKEIIEALKDGRRKGANSVVFTGGEPSLHPHILEAIKEAKKLNYEYIQLQTNGRTLAIEEFARKIKEAGVTEVSPALHGSKPEIHDKLTNSPGSFAQTVKGIINVKKLGIYVLTNTVITTLNYKDLPELAKLFVYLKVDQFQFAFVHIIGTAWENRKWIVPKKTDIMPYVKKGLDTGIKNGIKCYTEAIPYCFMKGYEECVAEKNIPEGPVVDADVYVENYGDYRRNEGKVKHQKCEKCVYYKICEGPWKEYPEIFGWDELSPVLKK